MNLILTSDHDVNMMVLILCKMYGNCICRPDVGSRTLSSDQYAHRFDVILT